MASDRIHRIVLEELGAVDPRVIAARVVLRLLPSGLGNRSRVVVLRALGFRVGAGTTIGSNILFLGGRNARRNVIIGEQCFINQGCVIDATAPVTVGRDVAFGHQVLITTSGHRFDHPLRRSGDLEPGPVRVGDGAWLASRVVVLPGVTIGEGAVVCAGAVVARDVDPHTLVGGVPAKLIRKLDGPDDADQR